MTTFPKSRSLLKLDIVLLDGETAVVQRIIALQYRPVRRTRLLQMKSVSTVSSGRSGALRLKWLPVEAIKLDSEIDAMKGRNP